MPNSQHVNTDLVSAPCVKLHCSEAVMLLARILSPSRCPAEMPEDGNLCVCRFPLFTDHAPAEHEHRLPRALPLPCVCANPFADLSHIGVGQTMDKANILFDNVMGRSLHPDPIRPHVRLGAEQHTTSLHIQTMHHSAMLWSVPANWEMQPQVWVLHPNCDIRLWPGLP